MQTELLSYFQGEKHGGLWFAAAGVVALVVSAFVWRTAYRPMIWPLAIIAVIQLAVGSVVYLRSDKQVAGLADDLARDAGAMRNKESERIAKVNLSFKVIEGVEIVLFVAGVAMAFALRQKQTWFAVGLGLILQSSAMLVLDLAAERRAHVYAEALDHSS